MVSRYRTVQGMPGRPAAPMRSSRVRRTRSRRKSLRPSLEVELDATSLVLPWPARLPDTWAARVPTTPQYTSRTYRLSAANAFT